MPLPWGNSQGISPEAPTGDHFWSRKGHSKRAHFGFKWALFVAKRLLALGANLTKKKLILHRKVRYFYFRRTFLVPGVPLELQGVLWPLPGPSSGSANAVISGQPDIHEDLNMRICEWGELGQSWENWDASSQFSPNRHFYFECCLHKMYSEDIRNTLAYLRQTSLTPDAKRPYRSLHWINGKQNYSVTPKNRFLTPPRYLGNWRPEKEAVR